MSTPTLLTIRDVAAVLGLSVGATYRRHQRGQLPAPVRIGRSLRWTEDSINAMIAAAMLAPALPAIMKAHFEYMHAAIIAGRTTPTPTPTTENEEMSK